MTERLEELIEYFNGYGSPFDDLIIDLARRMGSLSLSHDRLVAENIRLQEQSPGIELNLLNDEVVRLEKQNLRLKQALEEMRLHAHYPEIIKQIYEALERVSDG